MDGVDRWIEEEFQFLTTSQGFELAERGCKYGMQDYVTYRRRGVQLKACYDWHDGFDVLLSRDSNDTISVGTLIMAIETWSGGDPQITWDALEPKAVQKGIREIARFLRDCPKLLILDEALYRELLKLRFYHVGHWVKRWGRTIEMSPEEMQENREAVPKIMQLLKTGK